MPPMTSVVDPPPGTRGDVEALHEDIAKALAPLGLTGDRLQAFYTDAKAKPGELQEAVQRLIHMRDPSALVKLAKGWAEVNEGDDVKALKAAGFEVARDPRSGGFLARLPGRNWVPARDILRG